MGFGVEGRVLFIGYSFLEGRLFVYVEFGVWLYWEECCFCGIVRRVVMVKVGFYEFCLFLLVICVGVFGEVLGFGMWLFFVGEYWWFCCCFLYF